MIQVILVLEEECLVWSPLETALASCLGQIGVNPRVCCSQNRNKSADASSPRVAPCVRVAPGTGRRRAGHLRAPGVGCCKHRELSDASSTGETGWGAEAGGLVCCVGTQPCCCGRPAGGSPAPRALPREAGSRSPCGLPGAWAFPGPRRWRSPGGGAVAAGGALGVTAAPPAGRARSFAGDGVPALARKLGGATFTREERSSEGREPLVWGGVSSPE